MQLNQPNVISWSSTILLHPWVGERYWEGHLGHRLLILGESQYAEEAQPVTSTQTLIRDCVDNVSTERIHRSVQKVISGSDAEGVERERFWHSLAYYNFVQKIVGNKARIPPTAKMWSDALAPFQEVLSKLKPHWILVLGLNNWQNLPDWPCLEPILESSILLEVCAFTVDGHSGYATAIPHPTGSWGFRWDQYHKALSSFFSQYKVCPAVQVS